MIAPSLPNNYYVLHNGVDFKVLYMDAVSAGDWVSYGWETRCYTTNEEAQLEMAAWRDGKPEAAAHGGLTLVKPQSRTADSSAG